MSPHPASSRRNSCRSAGFTLVEVLVALTLLTTALVPAFVLASSAVNLSTRIRNSLIASNLAQEGIEVVRAIRDGNWFDGDAFEAGLDSCGSGCTVRYDSTSIPVLGVAVGTPLKLNSTTGLYQYTNGENSIFDRTVTVTFEPLLERLKVVSEVHWKERSVARTMTLEYYLYNWIK